MMQKVIIAVLFALVHSKELRVNHNSNVPDSKSKLADKVVGNSVNNFFGRALKTLSLHRRDITEASLDNAVLGKPCQSSIPFCTSLTTHPLLRRPALYANPHYIPAGVFQSQIHRNMMLGHPKQVALKHHLLFSVDNGPMSPSVVMCARAARASTLEMPALESLTQKALQSEKKMEALEFRSGRRAGLPSSIAQLDHLSWLWKMEQLAERKRYADERKSKTLNERVEQGVALRDLNIIDTDAALGGRVLLWLVPGALDELADFRCSPGTPVRLWLNDPDGDQAVSGIISSRQNDRIGVVVDEFPDALEEGGCHLDLDQPQPTFERGKKAIQRFREAEEGTPLSMLREVLFGHQSLTFGTSKNGNKFPQPFDALINEPQWEAIKHALSAEHLALIHGPPGTGKTRTLIEVIRQSVAQGQRVLASAASNAAVDNLAEKLAAAGLEVVRLGHPARVSDKMEAHSLDAKLERTTEYKLSRKWVIEANALRRQIAKKRNELSRKERRELYREMHDLFKLARSMLQFATDTILTRAEVVCTTAVGADARIMGDLHFDLVVLDEATQVTDPITLVACARGSKVIMAGDPCQLPPTVINHRADKAGLGVTFFERLAAQDQDALHMLTVQYRMHNAIMAFPSQNMYEGRLTAAPEVAQHRLHEIDGVASDPLRDAPFLFLDTSGKGWEEERANDCSTSNPLQAQRTAAEVQRLVSRGLQPSDIAVITPYSAQVKLLRSLLVEACAQGLEVDSVDGFQGREKEAIVLDLVRSNDNGQLGFVNDMRRMNVALTRARRFLMVIGDSATLGLSEKITALLKHAEQEDVYLSAWNDDAPLFGRR